MDVKENRDEPCSLSYVNVLVRKEFQPPIIRPLDVRDLKSVPKVVKFADDVKDVKSKPRNKECAAVKTVNKV